MGESGWSFRSFKERRWVRRKELRTVNYVLWLVVGLILIGLARLAWLGLVRWYDRQWFDSEGDGRYE